MNDKVTCFVCGHKTLDERCDWDICSVCCWEDDVLVQNDDADVTSPANKGLSIAQAQANYMLFGASTEQRLSRVRSANSDEPLDPSWKPLSEAMRLFEKMIASTSNGTEQR